MLVQSVMDYFRCQVQGRKNPSCNSGIDIRRRSVTQLTIQTQNSPTRMNWSEGIRYWRGSFEGLMGTKMAVYTVPASYSLSDICEIFKVLNTTWKPRSQPLTSFMRGSSQIRIGTKRRFACEIGLIDSASYREQLAGPPLKEGQN